MKSALYLLCSATLVLGCRARNQPAQPPAGGRLPPFDHKTGKPTAWLGVVGLRVD